MGIKDWMTRKVIQAKEQGDLSGKLDNAIDKVLDAKIERLKKKGEEVTVDRLCRGWEALKILGVSEEMVRIKAEEKMK